MALPLCGKSSEWSAPFSARSTFGNILSPTRAGVQRQDATLRALGIPVRASYDWGDNETVPAGAVNTSSPPSSVAVTVFTVPPTETLHVPAFTPET